MQMIYYYHLICHFYCIVIPVMQKSLIKVLTGQRRVGKSFLLYQLMEHILQSNPDANLIYINFEDFAYSKIQTAEDMHTYILLKGTLMRE